MSLKKIPIISESLCFGVEKSPDNTGIIFVSKQDNRKKVVAALLDKGDCFEFITIDHRGVNATQFNPKTQLMLKNKEQAPLSIERQMEIDTPFGRQMQVRYLYADERPSGVIVACREGNFLRSLLIGGEKEDMLCFYLAS